MLFALVSLYLAVTVVIGLRAARRVSTTRDYLVAGRSLPLYMTVATVFATWFGAETVLAVSSTFLRDGLGGVVGDPFGAAFCLFITALFFARPFYRMGLLTIGDFFRQRYNRSVEIAAAVAITISFLGWTSAQMLALGIVIHTVSGGSVELPTAIIVGASLVTLYTLFGGMWSVAITDMVQTVVIIVGLLYIAWLLASMAGGFDVVLAKAAERGRLDFLPKLELRDWLAFLGAWATMSIGAIAQQDVFQRVTSARDENTAVAGAWIGGFVYLGFAFVPMFIAVSALVLAPGTVEASLAGDGPDFQFILPQLILDRTPLFAQVMFFGALVSAILSSASGALLAPTAIFTENVVKAILPGEPSDGQRLLRLRIVLVLFAGVVLWFALNSEQSMYELVQSTYKVTLVAAFTPLVFGMFWSRATSTGAIASIGAGIVAWLLSEWFAPGSLLPPQLAGLAAAIVAMVAGSLLSRPGPALPLPAGAGARPAARSRQPARPGPAREPGRPAGRPVRTSRGR